MFFFLKFTEPKDGEENGINGESKTEGLTSESPSIDENSVVRKFKYNIIQKMNPNKLF